MASLSSSHVLTLLFLLSSLAFFSSASEVEGSSPPLAKGLSWSFYKRSCPRLEQIVRDHLKKAFKKDIGLAAGLLRLHFHDCFVQGCDGSVLLVGGGEQTSPPNLSLRQSALRAINDLRALIDRECGPVVSCADVAALAARDSVHLSGGPNYSVPLGRRDGFTSASNATTLASLPAPFFKTSQLISIFANLGLDATDLVALSGGHTIGIGHCGSFANRLFPSVDPIMQKTFAKGLLATCPTKDTVNTTVLDVRSPNKFDNRYFVDLRNREGLFTSDQDLFTDARTRPIVARFAAEQERFFDKFAGAMLKMGQLSVLTGTMGEVRRNCSVRNTGGLAKGGLWSVADGAGEKAAV